MVAQGDKVLIVGTGCCGTSFISRVLMEAGCDFGQGDPPASWTGPIRRPELGMEHPQTVRGSYDMHRILWPPGLLTPDYSRIDEAVRQSRGDLDEALALWPPFAKGVALGVTLPGWLRAGLRPTGIILCFRRLEETLQSLIRQRRTEWKDSAEHRQRLQTLVSILMVNVIDSGLPWAVVRFPSSVESESARPIYDDLQARIGLPCSREAFLAAHARVARPDLVHVKRGEPWEPLPKRSSS